MNTAIRQARSVDKVILLVSLAVIFSPKVLSAALDEVVFTSNSQFHMAGYADVGYKDTNGDNDSFDLGSFSPIFHYQYRDLVMLETELEIDVNATGETELALEYLTIDLFVNDYVALIAGKFFSPLGQFRQNMHPSWINKLPTAPIGFGHDQAAPNAEVGIQLRGGFPMGTLMGNYAAYIGKGPALESEDGELEMIETPGFGGDGDGKKVTGGRFGLFIPRAKLDIGFSAAVGKAAVWDPLVIPVTYEEARDYDVLGFDFSYRPGSFDLRGEYIQQKVGDLVGSAAPEGGTWQAWYVQGSYRFLPSKWEAVLRYGDYNTPQDNNDRTQGVVAVNYLFASNVIAKAALDFNDNPNTNQLGVENRLSLQLAYGF